MSARRVRILRRSKRWYYIYFQRFIEIRAVMGVVTDPSTPNTSTPCVLVAIARSKSRQSRALRW